MLLCQDLLVVVLDTSAAHWAAIEAATAGDGRLDLESFQSLLLVFLRSHLMLHWGNRVAVLTYDGSRRCVRCRRPVVATSTVLMVPRLCVCVCVCVCACVSSPPLHVAVPQWVHLPHTRLLL
jgi:hypothetical protein